MTLRQIRLGLVGVLTLVLLGTAGAFAFLPAGAATTSAVTKKGTGPFAGLEVTVSKTKNLSNEVVQVTWKGGAPTVPAGGVRRNFLQIMQCWGDSGPNREQCQFGASFAPFGAGNAITTRVVKSGSAVPVDPAEPTFPPSWTKLNRTYVPFKPVGAEPVPGDFNSVTTYFDLQGTNEIPIARTGGDGTGKEFFEIQTAREAPGLGCGMNVGTAKNPKGRACWLVVVPRGQVEVDGVVRDASYVDPNRGANPTYQRLDSSPLSASNWAKRIEFPLEFRPIGGACPEGGDQLQVLGHEFVTEALVFWQPQLCRDTGRVFNFSITPDAVARGDVTRAGTALAVVSDLPRSDGARLVYAPLTISGLGIAYFMEAQVDEQGSEAVRARDGVRIENLRLTPRLVAKLLTQSYRAATRDASKLDPDNPGRIEEDEEFLELNPQFTDNDGNGIPDVNGVGSNGVFRVIVPFGQADGWALVWRYIAADREARAFLEGSADPWGAVVNPAYKGVPLEGRTEFPQLDQSCNKPGADVGELCPPDAYPFVNDIHLGVADVIRGFSGSRTTWNPLALPAPRYDRDGAQTRGERALALIADGATAARYGLPMAQLQVPNRKGAFVGPTQPAMLAAVKEMKRGAVAGTLTPNPAPSNAAAYPLTVVSYAVASPAALSSDNRKAYAAFLNFAAGTGQQSGVLPAGYAALTTEMKKQTRAAASALTARTTTPTPRPNDAGGGGGGGGGSGGGSGGGDGGGGSNSGGGTGGVAGPGPAGPGEAPAPTPDPGTAVVPPASSPGTGTPVVQDPGGITPVAAIGNQAKAIPALLVLGLLALLAAHFAPRLWPAGSPGGTQSTRGGGAGAPSPSSPNSSDKQ